MRGFGRPAYFKGTRDCSILHKVLRVKESMWTALCSLDNFQFDHNKRQVKSCIFCTQNITLWRRGLKQRTHI